MSDPASLHPPAHTEPSRLGLRFLFAHTAHLVALGFGCGLSPKAAGTVGTLWAWASFLILARWFEDLHWAGLIGAAFALGWWACTLTARHMALADPRAIVWDEVLAFWLVLWLVMPTGFWGQLVAFLLFRFFDVVKPGPVAWADTLFKPRRDTSGAITIGWRQGFGILLDDLVAALCTLIVIALWRAW